MVTAELARKLATALVEIDKEVKRSKELHPGDFHNLHEGYAVLLEEVDELWELCKINKGKLHPSELAELKRNIFTEAKQIAAMATRIMIELT